MERLYLLDGSGYIYRAFFGIGGSERQRGERLRTTTGMPTGALYAFTQMIVRLHRDIKPERIAVVFDAPGRTFRKDIHDEYKATRREMPEDLKPQLPFFAQITESFHWPVLRVAGVEADDVIATLTARARQRGWAVTVLSGDKDLMQLVADGVEMVDPMRNITYDAAAVEKKHGVRPDQLRDYLALVGDTSDNVPGMPGIGPKTASKLLAKYDTVDGILSHVGELKGKQKERFEDPEHLAKLDMSRRLVTLKGDVELDGDLDGLVAGTWDGSRLVTLFRQLEFFNLLDRLGPVGETADGATDGAATQAEGSGPAQGSLPLGPAGGEAGPEVAIVTDPGQLSALVAPIIAAARAAKLLAVQVESDGSRPDRARVVGLALTAPDAVPVYIPTAHRYLNAPPQVDLAELPGELRALLADPDIGIVCHDVKNARRLLARYGVVLDGLVCDTLLATYLLDADRSIAIERVVGAVGVTIPPRKSLLGKGRTKIDFEAVAVDQAGNYAGKAAHGALLARDTLDSGLRVAKLDQLMVELELPVARLLADMEQIGICLDVTYLRQLSERVGAQTAALEAQVHELAGDQINIGSPKQLAALLFDKLGLKSDKMKKTKTGYSTSHEVLESLIAQHPVVQPILDHRELIKLKGTYLDALPPLVNPNTGRIHTSFNQAVAATGRLSSQDPNLQNIPIRTELGREIRRAFVAGAGKTLVSVDYSQIELRILAHLCGDPVLCRAFREGIDVHTQTAAEVFGLDLDAVGSNERRVAKAVNYGLIYGQSQFGLAQVLGIPQSEAKRYINLYFERFARVRTFMDETIASARETGMATTILGRRRLLPEIGARNFQRRRAAERMAQNTPMQGSAADIIKLAMLRVAARMERESYDAAMLLTVHDELIFEVVPDQAEDFAAAMAEEMEAAYELEVPLATATGIADNWADAH
ncbi:MAG: DNA polymerase I [Myxococcota bacterium]